MFRKVLVLKNFLIKSKRSIFFHREHIIEQLSMKQGCMEEIFNEYGDIIRMSDSFENEFLDNIVFEMVLLESLVIS